MSHNHPDNKVFNVINENNKHLITIEDSLKATTVTTTTTDLRDVLKNKSDIHRSFYYQLSNIHLNKNDDKYSTEFNENNRSDKMTTDPVVTDLVNKTSSFDDDDDDDNMRTDVIIDERILSRRLRKTGVFSREDEDDAENNSTIMKLEEETGDPDDMEKFPCVVKLVKMYTSMLQHRQSEMWQPVRDRAPRLSPDGGIWTSESSREEEDDEQVRTLDNEQEIETSDTSRMMNRSPVSDEGCATTQSPYASSDDEDAANGNRTGGRRRRDKVVRSSSSDSALGLDEDQPPAPPVRRMTLTVADIPLRPALLPLAEPTTLTCCGQVSTTTPSDQCGCGVRSRTLIEAQLIEIPADGSATTLINCATEDQLSSPMSAPHSRRESAQSYHSDVSNIGILGDHAARVRYVRTPSVVVSDYSDDIMCGITLEEIEYFRKQRRSSTDLVSGDNDGSDLSAASSCSNLNYCGSHISALDGTDCYQQQAGLHTPERKISNCSTCSTLSGDDDDSTFPLRLAEAIQRQHQQQQQQKKKVSHNTSLDVIEVNPLENKQNKSQPQTQGITTTATTTTIPSPTTPPSSPIMMMMSVYTTDKSKV